MRMYIRKCVGFMKFTPGTVKLPYQEKGIKKALWAILKIWNSVYP